MDGGNSSGNSLRARVRSGSSLPPAGAKGKAFRVAAAGLHWFRPVVHAPARNFSGRVEPDFHQRPTRLGRTFSCLDPGAWTRADFWVDRQFYPRAGFLFAAAYQILAKRGAVLPGWTCWVMWTGGVLMRWFANSYLWHWRVLLPVSAALELAAFLIFFRAVSSHKRLPSAQKKPIEMWMVTVILATCAFLLALIVNLAASIYVARSAADPAFPHRFDQRYLVLLGWGVLVPMVWGFTARWVPVFLGLEQPQQRLLLAGLMLDYAGVVAASFGFLPAACVLLLGGALAVVLAVRMSEPAVRPPKLIGVHTSFPVFVRMAYAWMIVAACLGVWASKADRAGGIWGSSRHALTVGFISTMVFAIGPRVLPFFTGFVRIFSTRLMFAALALLNLGCFLRVTSEVIAYEGHGRWAWSVLPVSAVTELTAVSIFALNLLLTFLRSQKSEDLAAAVGAR